MDAEPILYSFRRCPYAMRARMALLVARVRCALREVRLADKPAELIAASPKATVPVLVLPDGSVIDESLDIMRWALARHDPERWLDGDDGALIAINDGAFKHHLDRYKYPGRFEPAEAAGAIAHRAAALALLDDLERRLDADGWFCGEARGLADIAIFPFVRQFAMIEPGWFAVQPLAGLRRWLAALTASPLFAAAMAVHPPWRAGLSPVPLGPWTDAPAIG